jgi:uncharacterized protein DUF935
MAARRGEQLAFRGFPTGKAPASPLVSPKGEAPSGEVATVQRGEFMGAWNIVYPNPSRVLRYRANGEGLRFYRTLHAKNPELRAQFKNLYASILKCPRGIRAASDSPEHMLHAEFVRFAFGRLKKFQSYLRHKLTAIANGFAVTERVYEVVREGKWAGAIVYASLLDKPAEWFQFDPQRRLLFLSLDNPFPGELVDQTKFSVSTWGSVSNPYGEPVNDEAYFYCFLKEHALKNEALYMEAFASPTVNAQYTAARDPTENRDRMNRALTVAMSVQSNNAISSPSDMALKLIESARSTAISYSQYIDRLDEGIARVVSGATLASMASSGHSFGQAKTHESKNTDRTEEAADWAQAEVSDDEVRDMVDRNFGPQDAYPEFYVHAKSAGERQAEIEIEMSEVELGHDVGKRRSAAILQIEEPEDDGDHLTPLPGINLPQPLPVQQGLAGEQQSPTERLRSRRIAFAAGKAARTSEAETDHLDFAFRHSRDAYTSARGRGFATRSSLTSIGSQAKKAARPALRKVIASAARPLRSRRALSGVSRGDLYGGIKKLSGVGDLGGVFGTMFSRASAHVRMAAGSDAPPALSTPAKIALALQVMAIYEKIFTATTHAPDSIKPSDFVDSLTSAEGLALDETFANLFDNTHDTDIATIEAANLRRLLASDSWRREFPYLMVINANPSPSSADRFLDGWVVASDEAFRNPSALPPYHFGCQCVAVPISAAEASAAGFAGTFPLGTMTVYAAGRGASPYAAVGKASGFSPVYADTHTGVTLSALRDKAYQLQRDDPFAWASLVAWLTWLFGFDVLRQDPKEETDVAA